MTEAETEADPETTTDVAPTEGMNVHSLHL
jgi:hypothetical protein